ncbi:hypothetical protein BU24DRAFT_495998 [Aaosphaeria arxii CBS 175.79]|uniref:Cytidyltransferase-like domain-containing protein n=1 Tax=Aaosphaeria arxii CBS 175.79 TaxID=1450172 RepID=A0A6A5XCT0_9PLEO|nr:uncharacterized protein BU24DRAFT_495998 [Aaosphaeria arxii CBS 175.79]KAF2010802.1 hypothetical protein BU24DRAFT_495998 [Aaosphaeria arxii CBS 175.79]
MEKTEISFKSYLQMAYNEIGLTSETDLGAIQALTGTLQSDNENLLLVYAGSFNPPHRGHINALLSGLRPEVAAVAIIILPSEDWHLRNKISKNCPEFFLPQIRRAELWGAISSVTKERVWVWTATWYPFKPVTEALLRLTSADGFKLSIARLVGPDNLDIEDPLNIMPIAFPGAMFTNRARHIASHFLSNGQPVVWNGFGEWSRTTRSYGDSDGEVGEAGVVLWTCTGTSDSDPPKRGYYLKYSKPVTEDISSTKLRQTLIRDHNLDEETLSKLSLSALLELLEPVLREN